jgi:hypothetical protein
MESRKKFCIFILPPGGDVAVRQTMTLIYSIRSHKCPLCGSPNIHRSKRKGIAERVACTVTPIKPFRCNDCYGRMYAVKMEERQMA